MIGIITYEYEDTNFWVACTIIDLQTHTKKHRILYCSAFQGGTKAVYNSYSYMDRSYVISSADLSRMVQYVNSCLTELEQQGWHLDNANKITHQSIIPDQNNLVLVNAVIRRPRPN
jgi:hypothetical protein